MSEFKGFRADRLKKAMTENEVTVEDKAKSLYKVFEFTDMDFASDCAKSLMYSDNYNIPIGVLYSACKAVNVSADYLLGLSDEMY